MTREQLLSRFIADNDGRDFNYLEGSDAAEWLKAGHASPTGVTPLVESICDGLLYSDQKLVKDFETILYHVVKTSDVWKLSLDQSAAVLIGLRAIIIDSARREIALAIKDAA